jgi:hypothetical protein
MHFWVVYQMMAALDGACLKVVSGATVVPQVGGAKTGFALIPCIRILNGRIAARFIRATDTPAQP